MGAGKIGSVAAWNLAKRIDVEKSDWWIEPCAHQSKNLDQQRKALSPLD